MNNKERLEVREIEANEEPTLVTELLSMMKKSLTRAHTIIIVLIALLFISNLIWLYFWNLPTEEILDSDQNTEYSIDQDSGDSGNNNYIGNDGDIINGKTNN